MQAHFLPKPLLFDIIIILLPHGILNVIPELIVRTELWDAHYGI